MYNILYNYQSAFEKYFSSTECKDAINSLVNRIPTHKRILLIANGGSLVGVAMHFEEDCSKLLGIPCLTLSNPGYITCLGNDEGFENIYVNWLNTMYQPGDLLIAISSSGESEDIVRACMNFPGGLVTLSGFNKYNRLSRLGNINIHIPSNSYGEIESIHATLLHIVLDTLIEEKKKNE